MSADVQTASGTRHDTTQAGYFVIADISGYTGFLAHNELAHAQSILAEITELLIEHLSAPFRFVELEGDAVFVFAPSVAIENSERLIDIMESCYAAFRMRVEQMVQNTSCERSACRTIPDLDLKCVGHYGQYVPQKSPTGTKLVGPDVILVHRLLKNAVIEKTGVHAYALLTDAFIDKAAFGDRGLGLPRYEEEIAELGLVQGRVVDLAASVERYRAAARKYVGASEADVEISIDLPAPRSLVWGYFIDAKRRSAWQTDTTSVKNFAAPNGRSGIGLESHCDHGSYGMNHRIVDWQPFDYVTMETVLTYGPIIKPPRTDVTFELLELDESRSRLFMRLRTTSRGLLVRLAFTIMKPIINRSWRGHFSVLERLVREDVGQAEEAAAPLSA